MFHVGAGGEKMRLLKRDNKFILSCEYGDKEIAKHLGFLWNPITKEWWTNKLNSKVVDYVDRNIVTLCGSVPEFDELASSCRIVQSTLKHAQEIGKDSEIVKRLINLYSLYPEQAVVVAKAITLKRYGFFCETGTGKTRMALAALSELGVRALIVCPLSLINVWIKEGEKINVKIDNLRIQESSKKFKQTKEQPPKINHGAINYEQFKKIKKEDFEEYSALVIDESAKLKDPGSQITKFCCNVSQTFDNAFLLSGTPAPNSPLEFWGQSFVINPEILGDNYYRFRRTYAVACGFENRNFYVSPEKRQVIAERLAPHCSYLKKEEIVNLPEKVFEEIDVDLSKEESDKYINMLREKILMFKDATVIAPNIITEIMKLRQITSGFVYINADGDLKPLSVGASKLSALDDLLESIGNEQAIVFTNFREEVNSIWKRRQDVACIYGGQTDEDRTSAVDSFVQGVKRVLVANIEAAARGFTFVNAKYIIFFSHSWSNELFSQAQDRIHRIGQKHKCTYYVLNALANGKRTIDHKIWNALQKKSTIQDEMLEMIKEYEGV